MRGFAIRCILALVLMGIIAPFKGILSLWPRRTRIDDLVEDVAIRLLLWVMGKEHTFRFSIRVTSDTL